MRSTKIVFALLALVATGLLSACANYEVNSKRGNIPGYFIRYEMQEADRAVESARQAGKDKLCPAEFKAAEAAKDNAYDVFRACNTEEGAALAKKATAMANALCPPRPAKAAPVTAPAAPPTGAPDGAATAVSVPAPKARLTITPGSIKKGETAQLAWTAQDATGCTIQPGIGQVQTEGSQTVSPAENTTYTLVCTGAGGTADSKASIIVNAQAKQCSPVAIHVLFDFDKAAIKSEYQGELKKLADFLIAFPNATGTIVGHTDNSGPADYNLKLSERRANNGRAYLVKKLGVDGKRISTKGLGLTKPIADNSTREGRHENRRIEADFTCNN